VSTDAIIMTLKALYERRPIQIVEPEPTPLGG
jgi:hypothetical protein